MQFSEDAAPARPAAIYWILAVGLASFSTSPILVRFADEAPGLAIAVWRTVFAAALLAPFAIRRVVGEVRRFSIRDTALIGAAGVFLGLHFVTWIESLYYTSVASATVLVTTSPIFLAVLGTAFLRERLRAHVWVGIVISVAGAALIGWGDAASGGEDSLLGNGLSLTAALLVSFYLLIGRIIRQRASWLAYVFPLYGVVALTTLVVAGFRHMPLFGYGPAFYGLCLLMALGPQLAGHGSFNYALKYFPAALLGLLSLLEPVGASLLAYVLFDETPAWIALVGMLLVLGAVVYAIVSSRVRRPVPREQPASGASHG